MSDQTQPNPVPIPVLRQPSSSCPCSCPEFCLRPPPPDMHSNARPTIPSLGWPLYIKRVLTRHQGRALLDVRSILGMVTEGILFSPVTSDAYRWLCHRGFVVSRVSASQSPDQWAPGVLDSVLFTFWLDHISVAHICDHHSGRLLGCILFLFLVSLACFHLQRIRCIWSWVWPRQWGTSNLDNEEPAT